MTIEQEILSKQMEIGALDADRTAHGVALAAIDKGYDKLTARQQHVLVPFLSSNCQGVTDPGGYHNECQMRLEGEDFVSALEHSGYYGSPLCERCRDEVEDHRARWDRFNAE